MSKQTRIRQDQKPITKGVVYNFSIKLAYLESAQNNDQRSDG